VTERLSPVPPRHILAAARRLKRSGLVRRTPTEQSRPLSARVGADVYQKLELFQPTGSFKPRGSANKLLRVRDEEPDAFRRGFVAASAGNHGLGVSHAAAALGARATLVVPRTVSPAKLEALWRYPVELIVSIGNYDAAEAEGRRLAKERGLVFVSPYNDADVIAGAGTVGLEVLEDLSEVDAILVPVGGGGLIAGIALWVKAVAPRVRVIGVQSDAYPAMQAALGAGGIVTVADKPSMADGLAGNIEAGSITFDLCRRFVDDMVLVTEEEIAESIRYFAREEQLLVEGSGAVGAAALLAGKIDPGRIGPARPKIVDVVTGRNIAEARLRDILGVPAAAAD
jgi:threonine dehydratase